MKKTSSSKIVTLPPGPRSKELLELKNKYVTRASYMTHPIFVDEGKGALIKDVDGNTYIDFAGGIGVLNAGHCPPEVVDAVKKQVEKSLHTCFHIVPYEGYVKLAKKLTEITPGSFPKKVLLINSGAEAVENAVKIAMYYTKRPVILVFENAFHGRTRLAMAATSKVKPYKFGFAPFVSNFDRLPYAYCYRCPFGLDYPSCEMRCLKYIEESFITRNAAEEVAAMLVEPVLGEGGFVVPPDEFIPGLRKICDERGILLILDEIQSGMGRTGKMFCCEHWGVEPDLILTAKSLAAGLPLSAVIGKAEIMDAPHVGGLGGTYGGNPVSCAAALEAINIVQRNLQHAKKIGENITKRFKEMYEKYPIIGDVRGKGPMVGIELVKDRKTKEPAEEETKQLIEYCYKHGLIVIKCGSYGNVIRIHVPLVISEETLDEGLEILEDSIKEIERMS